MQISTSYLFDRATKQMGSVQADLAKTQAQVAAQKQVLSPSDAPDKAAAIQRLKSVMSRQDSYSHTLETVNSRLNSEDTTLSNASDILIRVKELSIQANTDTMSSNNRKSLGAELQGLRNQLLSLANTQDSNGNYLFAGSQVRQPAFADNGAGKIVYLGDQTRMNVVVGEQRSIPINRTGSDAFVRVVRAEIDPTTKEPNGILKGVGFFESLDDLIKGVNGDDTSVDSNVGLPDYVYNNQKSPAENTVAAKAAEAENIAFRLAYAMKQGTGEVDGLLQGILLARANVGTDMRVVEQQQNVVDETTLNLKSTLSNIEDLDYVEAIAKMKKQMLALEATQSSFAQISRLSLFNYIK
jgi:flagellar hook-associated protein 3 FlgL